MKETDEGIKTAVRERFYAVVGSSIASLRSALVTLGPSRNGHDFGAFTDWEVTWRYRRVRQHGTRVIAALRIDVAATITLPRWSKPRGASREVVETWERYLAAVRDHEQGHVDIAIDAGRAVRDRLTQLGPFDSAASLDEAARTAGDAALAAARARDEAYDLRTRHGAAQGARL